MDWFESPLQKIVFGIGSIFIAVTSFLLGSWTVLRIVKSQRLTAQVLFRRRELMAAVGAMHFAVKEKQVGVKPQDVPPSNPGAIPQER